MIICDDGEIAKLIAGDDPISAATRAWLDVLDLTPILSKGERATVKQRVARVCQLRGEYPVRRDEDAWG